MSVENLSRYRFKFSQVMAHAVRRRTLTKQRKASAASSVSPVFRTKRIHSCRNIVGLDTKYRTANIQTELVLRNEKLTPERLEAIKTATQNLSDQDKDFLVQVFNEGDGRYLNTAAGKGR